MDEITSLRKKLAKLQKEKQPIALLNEITELNKYVKTLEDSNNDLINRNYILKQELAELRSRYINADELISLIKMGEMHECTEYGKGRNGGIAFAVERIKQMKGE